MLKTSAKKSPTRKTAAKKTAAKAAPAKRKPAAKATARATTSRQPIHVAEPLSAHEIFSALGITQAERQRVQKAMRAAGVGG
jgi:hypothetical protein